MRGVGQPFGHAVHVVDDALAGADAQQMERLRAQMTAMVTGWDAAAVREIVDGLPPPPGVQVYVTGPAALTADIPTLGQLADEFPAAARAAPRPARAGPAMPQEGGQCAGRARRRR